MRRYVAFDFESLRQRTMKLDLELPRSYGVLPTRGIRMATAEKILTRVVHTTHPTLPTPCWEWAGHRDPGGYGRVNFAGRMRLAHRAVYLILVGDLGQGRILRHLCDNPPCVNPAHLTLGSMWENSQDAGSRGQRAKGERLPQSKITESDAFSARVRYAAGETLKEIGISLGIHESTVSSIARGHTWQQAGGPIVRRSNAGIKRKLSPEQSRQIYERVRSGERAVDLLGEFGIGRAAATRYLKEHKDA